MARATKRCSCGRGEFQCLKWKCQCDERRRGRLFPCLGVRGSHSSRGLGSVGGLSDGTKIVLTLEAGHRESEASWSSLLRRLKRRGLRCSGLVIGDGHLGIWAATRKVFPEAEEQRCWNHRILNVLDRIPKRDQAQAKPLLTALLYMSSLQECETHKVKFLDWCMRKGLAEAAHVLDEDWDRMVSLYSFPKPHWQHLRTSNVVESPFAALRLGTDAAKTFKKVGSATAAIFKLLLVAEKNSGSNSGTRTGYAAATNTSWRKHLEAGPWWAPSRLPIVTRRLTDLASRGEQRVRSQARYCVGSPAATECRTSTEANTSSQDLNSHGCLPVNSRSSFFADHRRGFH